MEKYNFEKKESESKFEKSLRIIGEIIEWVKNKKLQISLAVLMALLPTAGKALDKNGVIDAVKPITAEQGVIDTSDGLPLNIETDEPQPTPTVQETVHNVVPTPDITSKKQIDLGKANGYYLPSIEEIDAMNNPTK